MIVNVIFPNTLDVLYQQILGLSHLLFYSKRDQYGGMFCVSPLAVTFWLL